MQGFSPYKSIHVHQSGLNTFFYSIGKLSVSPGTSVVVYVDCIIRIHYYYYE